MQDCGYVRGTIGIENPEIWQWTFLSSIILIYWRLNRSTSALTSTGALGLATILSM